VIKRNGVRLIKSSSPLEETPNYAFPQNLSAPEGLVLLADRRWLVVDVGPGKGCTTHIGADGRSQRTIGKIGRPNALTVDKDGVVWAAESINPPSLVKVTMHGDVDVVFTRCDGTSFLFANVFEWGALFDRFGHSF
jgi:hypothetical protein